MSKRRPGDAGKATGVKKVAAKKPSGEVAMIVRGRLWLDAERVTAGKLGSGRSQANGSPMTGSRTAGSGRTAALTEAGADLLEQIGVCGSLSEAARRLGFAYRRAWLLVDAMNRAWPSAIVTTATGGKRGGGAVLTERGKHIVAAYRDLQLQLEHLLDGSAAAFRLPGEKGMSENDVNAD